MDSALTGVGVPKVAKKSPETSEKLSVMLDDLANNAVEKITIQNICDALGDRSFGAFLLVFCIPNLVPLPPGSSLILGIPMIIIAFQIMVGHSKIWLPRKLAEYSLSRETFRGMIARINPYVARGELMIKKRNWPVNNIIADKVFGFFTLILAIVVTIPIPLGNWPPAFAIAILAAAYTKRDGLCLIVGSIVGIISLLLAGSVVVAGVLVFLHVT